MLSLTITFLQNQLDILRKEGENAPFKQENGRFQKGLFVSYPDDVIEINHNPKFSILLDEIKNTKKSRTYKVAGLDMLSGFFFTILLTWVIRAIYTKEINYFKKCKY